MKLDAYCTAGLSPPEAEIASARNLDLRLSGSINCGTVNFLQNDPHDFSRSDSRIKRKLLELLAENPNGLSRRQILSFINGRSQYARHALKDLLHRKVILRRGDGTRNNGFSYFLKTTDSVTTIQRKMIEPLNTHADESTVLIKGSMEIEEFEL
jgi:hypothetical protein